MEQPDVFLTKLLDSGVQVIGQPMAGVESAAIGFLVGSGARDERESELGVSHFTEQMLFRGTEHLDARQLSDQLDTLGISYDSSAGLEMTIVTGVMLGDQVPAALDLLTDCVRFPAFPVEATENVRTLLLQELAQREDQPGQKVMDELRQIFFAGTPLGHDVLGNAESIASITRADLHRYWSERYTANNLTVSIAGNFDWDDTIAQLERVTADWPTGSGRMILQPPATRSDLRAIVRDRAQENIGFAFPGPAASDAQYYAAGLLAQAFGGGSNSRLYREVRVKRGLAYAIQARFDGLEKIGLFRVYVGTSADRAHESVEVIMEELAGLERSGITDDELRLAKTRLKSQLVMRSESTSTRMAANLRSWWFEQRLRGLQEVKDLIDRVTKDEVLNLVQNLHIRDNLAAVALGPRSENELFGSMLAGSERG